jgi:hypothetical protein
MAYQGNSDRVVWGISRPEAVIESMAIFTILLIYSNY